MKTVFVSPAASPGKGYSSQYFVHLKQELSSCYKIMDSENRGARSQSLALLGGALSADIAMLSFVETIAFHRFPVIQSGIALLALDIMHLRGCKVVFFFHNPKPHKGESRLSRRLTEKLFKVCSLVVCHSENTAEIAREKVPGKKVILAHHPVENLTLHKHSGRPCRDVLIWGDIYPYKGVAEFLEEPSVAISGLRIDIIGRCKDAALEERIRKCCNDRISYRNERPSMEEVPALVGESSFVLFPYLEGSISGSGVLMDTIAAGGTAVGPDTGAFHDLSLDGLCLTYKNIDELISILTSTRKINPSEIESFILANSWKAFVGKIVPEL